MPPWRIIWTAPAAHDLHRLDRQVARRIAHKLDQVAGDPCRAFVPLKGRPDSKLRVGDYRVIAVLAPQTRTILVQKVDHRSRAYR